MKLEKDKLITLSDGIKYFVVETAILKGKKYVYLIDENNPSNFKFCREKLEKDRIKLTLVTDEDERNLILKGFYEILKDNSIAN